MHEKKMIFWLVRTRPQICNGPPLSKVEINVLVNIIYDYEGIYECT